MKNKILVFDDIIDLDHQNKIKSVLTGDGQHKDFYFPWYLTPDVTVSRAKNSQKRPAFFHGFVIEKKGSVGIIDSCLLYTSPSPRDRG